VSGLFSSMFGAMGRAMIGAVPTVGEVLREYAPAYLTHVSPIQSQFLADQHKMLEQQLVHIEDRNTRAIVAAMLLAGSSIGPYAKQ